MGNRNINNSEWRVKVVGIPILRRIWLSGNHPQRRLVSNNDAGAGSYGVATHGSDRVSLLIEYG